MSRKLAIIYDTIYTMSDDNQKQTLPPLIEEPEEIKRLPEVEVKIPFSQPPTEVVPPAEPIPEPIMTEEAPVATETYVSSPIEPSIISASPNSILNTLKKLLILILIAAIVLGGGFFVYKKLGSRIGRGGVVTLIYWGLWEPEEAMRGVLLEWEASHPNIKINYSRQSPEQYRERLQSALARNEGPDIFRYHLSWVPMLKNELEPIPSSVMSVSQFESTYYPVINQNLKVGGSIVGIPLMVDDLVLYYNEDIFQAAGKNPPASWDELRQTAADLTVKNELGQIQTAGVALGATTNVDHWSDILGLMMRQNSADLAAPGDCRTQGQEEVCLGPDALTFYTIFSRIDRVWDSTMPASTMAFATGKVAMYFGPSWRFFDIKAINPNLNFKMVPVPQLPETKVAWASFWVEGVSKKSQSAAQAWEFLKYLASPAVLEKLYQAQSNIRLFGEFYPRVDMADKIKDNPLILPFIDQLTYAQTWYLCSNTYDNGINDKIIKYYEDAVNAVNSGTDAKKALETTSQGVAQILSQYGISTAIVR